MNSSEPISLDAAFASLTFEASRTPESTDISHAFCELARYRGGVGSSSGTTLVPANGKSTLQAMRWCLCCRGKLL